jgi:hypothetical protein
VGCPDLFSYTLLLSRGASRVSNEDSDALLENLLGELGGSDAAPAPAAPSLGGSASALGGAGSGSFGAAASAAAPPVIARPVARYCDALWAGHAALMLHCSAHHPQ